MKFDILGNLLSFINSILCKNLLNAEEETYVYDKILIFGHQIKNYTIQSGHLLTNVTKLYIESTSLEDFPVGVKDLPNIRELVLLGNKNFKNFKNLSFFPNLETLSIIGQSLKIIPPEVFKMKNLKNLNLVKNFLENIPEEIENLKNLEEIHLSFNSLKNLPDNFFKLTNLHKIILNGNKLENISPKIINLQKLNILNLQENNFLNFPEEIIKCKNLKHLNLSANEIKEIPDKISHFNKLENFYLCKNQLEKFPVSLLEIQNLKNLNLSFNKIKEFPKKFKHTKFLNNLDLSWNQLNDFPESLFSKIGVNHLNLEKNKIKYKKEIKTKNFFYRYCPNFILKIIKYFSLLKNTKVRNSYIILNLSDNEMEELPEIILSLNFLVELNLSNNSFKSMVYDFKKLKNLRNLNLSEIKLKKLSNSLCLTQLKHLNISKNKLTDIPKDILDMKNIKELDLSYNEITEFPQLKTGENLFNLKNVNFKFNKIESLENKFFPRVENLDLSNNIFKKFPSEILDLKFLECINLKNNEISELDEKDYELLKANKIYADISWNFIKFKSGKGNDKEFIEKIDKDGFISFLPQLDKKISISEVFENHKKEDLHWNIEKLKKIKLEINVEELAKNISDKTMRRMWRDVLKYFIADDETEMKNDNDNEKKIEIENELDTESTIEIGEDKFENDKSVNDKSVNDKSVNDKSVNKLIENCKIDNIKFKTRFNLSISSQSKRKIISNYLRRISKEYSQENNKIKSYIKLIFVKLLEVIEANKDEEIENLIANLTNLCNNTFHKCVIGQTEGLKYYYSVYYKKNVEIESIESLLVQKIAAIKEEMFISCCQLVPTANLHFVNVFRQIFENILGISNEIEDPYDVLEVEDYKGKAGNILEAFFKKFSVENVIVKILEEIEINQNYTNQAFEYLSNLKKNETVKLRSEKTLSANEIDKINYETRKNYFKYIKDGSSVYYYDKLNRSGLLEILRCMNLVENEKKLD